MGLRKLTFDEVLPILENVEYHGDNISARCPSHDDKKNSLSVTRGKNGEAVCNCFANCSPSAIFEAIYQRLGVSRSFEEEEPVKKPTRKIVARYEYTDENGAVYNTKIRYSNKDFIWKAKGKNHYPLFNLQEVIKKNPIFVVEGEKDVLTIKKFGYGATNSKDGFTPENVKKYLSGKDIIIIPDNDRPGFDYALKASDMLNGIANSIKMVNLKKIWNDIPDKADITDFIEHGGSIEQVLEIADPEDGFLKMELEPSNRNNHPHYDIWKDIEGYTLNSKNQIVYVNGDTTIPLCHGSIVITEDIFNNDGLNDNILFKCDGVTESGEHLPEVTIPVEDFDSLKWISKKWGCSIVTFGTQSTTQRLISGIKLTGRLAKTTYQKCHTGYVNNSNGKPIAYLHAKGSIGNQDLICELSDELQQYALSGCSTSEEERKEAFKSSLSLLNAHRESVVYPLLSFVYMPPLAQINREVNGECGFCLYLRGKTQNGKSTLASLSMNHFGRFTSTTPPTSFESTSNRNELLSFLLKDSILWVDDFHPKGSKSERDKQNEQFNRISRASGDRASRGRLNSNSELMRAYKPRCLYLVTGEDEPMLSQSGLARIFTIDVKTERRDISALLKASRRGLLSRAMSDYISYIINNYEAVTSTFERIYEKVINGTRADIGENRLSIQSALLITSFDMWLYYALKTKLLDSQTAEELSSKNRSIIMRLAHKNSNEIKESDPCEKFINTLAPMISNREVELRDCRIRSEDNELYNDYSQRIGWFDDDYFYLDAERTYSAVKNKLESVEDSIGATMRGLYRDMMDSHYIEGEKNSFTRVKNINGKNKRVIYILKSVLERNK